MKDSKVTFRFAGREDAGLILGFIKKLAEYEHMEEDVVATEALLREWIFDREKACSFWRKSGAGGTGRRFLKSLRQSP